MLFLLSTFVFDGVSAKKGKKAKSSSSFNPTTTSYPSSFPTSYVNCTECLKSCSKKAKKKGKMSYKRY